MDKFFDFVMQAAHANPGERFPDLVVRTYQQYIVDVIFTNQVANAGTFASDDPCADEWVYSGSTFMAVVGVLVLLLLLFLLVIYSLRRTGRDMMAEIARLRRRPVASAPPAVPVIVNTGVNTIRTSNINDTTSFMSPLPGYEALRPSFNPAIVAQAAIVEESDDDNAQDDANDGDESDVGGGCGARPYPLMEYPGCPINVIEPPHVVDRPN